MHQRDYDDMTMSVKTAGSNILMFSCTEIEKNMFLDMHKSSENYDFARKPLAIQIGLYDFLPKFKFS